MNRIEIKIKGPTGWQAVIDRKIEFEATDQSAALLAVDYLNEKGLISLPSPSVAKSPADDIHTRLLALGYVIESWRLHDQR